MNDGHAIIAGYLVLLVVGFFVICLPIFIAFWREHPNRWPIFVLTVALGATVIGWLVALVWSLHGVHRSKGAVPNGGESGLNLFANDALAVHQNLSNKTALTNSILDQSLTPAQEPIMFSPGITWAATQINRLYKLRQSDHLSDREYEELKASVLLQISI